MFSVLGSESSVVPWLVSGVTYGLKAIVPNQISQAGCATQISLQPRVSVCAFNSRDILD